MKPWFLAAFLAPAIPAAACSGLHVQETIQRADHFGRMGATFTVIVAFISWGLRRNAVLFVAIASFVLHPAWTLSSGSGDCGGLKISATILVGLICIGTLLWDALRHAPHHS